ncbi:MAG: 50S ribosomal protein L10 [Planctomycetes bacterium]|nr:50S ribosomal protein L10 [Planctomycetota bacterium]
MSKVVKKQMIKELSSKYKSLNNWVMVNYQGLKAREASDLRSHLRNQGVKMNMAKNAVISFTFQDVGWEKAKEIIQGPVALVYGEPGSKSDDPITISKSLVTWKTKNADAGKMLVFRGGYTEGRYVSATEVSQLASIPPREALLGRLAGGFKSPLTRLAWALDALPQKMARLVGALAEKKK